MDGRAIYQYIVSCATSLQLVQVPVPESFRMRIHRAATCFPSRTLRLASHSAVLVSLSCMSKEHKIKILQDLLISNCDTIRLKANGGDCTFLPA